MTVGDDYKILELKERIAELKERVLYNYNKNAELSQIREVLRELIETVNLRGEISQTSADKLLAKLSGISVLEEIKKESPWQIGSGGEKEVRVRHSEFDERNVPSDDLSTHSKPPEPILVKREDLQELYYWGDIEEDDLKYMHNLEPKELERYKNFRKRIKEEYSL